ncbi:signal recognition particle subunit srp72 [Plakobranchus ocellatus]|uniref:Signal recognition particle subunit SRP72 n=1 Tax=Plakobranchus ocellatus TaxID=259542 RepID=A0AAV4BPD1_9GAST|nr:signal recognition particle subunit srp72 [Plakobranchus ocellatus]
MAQQATLPNMYADLNRCGQKQEYEKAIRIANKILQQQPSEFAAFNCKVVSLILLDRFDEALSVINKDKVHTGLLKFEKAYCEYRLNRTKEALTTLRSITNHDTRSKELLCQVLYRMEDFEECFDLYRDVIKNSQDDNDGERETNLAAVVASMQLWGIKDMDDAGLEEDSYEICYNNACYYIGKGDLNTGLEKLAKAEELLKNDPDLAEDELEEELAIIRVQRGYIYQCQGQNDQASQLYNQVLKIKPSDAGILAVVSNNVVTINKDQNIFDSKRKIKAATGDNLKHKTVSAQRKHIDINQCLVHMYSNQSDQCHQLAKKLIDQYPEMATPVLIRAAQFIRDKKSADAIAFLQEFARSHPEQSFQVQMIIAQLYLNQGSVYQACDALKALGDDAYKPGMVSALVTLYLSQEDKDSASEVLINAVNWYKKKNPKSPALLMLTRANADYQLKNGKAEEAAKMLEDLRKANPKDALVLAQLISSYAQFDPLKAQQISKDLPTVDKITQGLDIDSLEASFSTLGPKYMKKQQPQKGEASPASGDARSGETLMLKKKQRKKKKGKLPKNCEPGSDIDPERWLPRKERSYYRGKRKDKRKEIGKGTQGMSAASQAIADSLDASKQQTVGDPSSPRANAASPQSTPVAAQGPRLQKPVQANKKKKKAGKKGWFFQPYWSKLDTDSDTWPNEGRRFWDD